MINRLTPILQQKKQEVTLVRKQMADVKKHPLHKILSGQFNKKNNKFKFALSNPYLSVIAEIKRKSPSRGTLAAIEDPVELANRYRLAGANAISILTDTCFFNGSLKDLEHIVQTFGSASIPLLRKDFIIDEIQIAEAVMAGADAVLLIVAVLGERTQFFIEQAHFFGLDALVEIHTDEELKIALNSGAEIIGINNRDLNTFLVDPNKALELKLKIPRDKITVAESGILSAEMAKTYHTQGFNAVLIGEALVTSISPEIFIKACQHG